MRNEKGQFIKGGIPEFTQGMRGKKHSEITKKKMSKNNRRYWQGKHFSKEHRKHLSENYNNYNPSVETRKKISKANKGRKFPYKPRANKGANHYFWQGGKSFEPYPVDWVENLRDTMRKRDDYTCQICGIHQDELEGRFKKLAVHHIDYDKNNLNPENLISLCKNCHSKTNFNRDYWLKYFYENK